MYKQSQTHAFKVSKFDCQIEKELKCFTKDNCSTWTNESEVDDKSVKCLVASFQQNKNDLTDKAHSKNRVQWNFIIISVVK